MNNAEKLMRLAELAIGTYNLENGCLVSEVSLGTTYDIGGKEAYAFTKNSIIFWDGTHEDFAALNEEDILTLEQAIAEEYEVEIY